MLEAPREFVSAFVAGVRLRERGAGEKYGREQEKASWGDFHASRSKAGRIPARDCEMNAPTEVAFASSASPENKKRRPQKRSA